MLNKKFIAIIYLFISVTFFSGNAFAACADRGHGVIRDGLQGLGFINNSQGDALDCAHHNVGAPLNNFAPPQNQPPRMGRACVTPAWTCIHNIYRPIGIGCGCLRNNGYTDTGTIQY